VIRGESEPLMVYQGNDKQKLANGDD
jgi:hypothetical protein